jgi:lysophospholipase L1-like esterase
MPRAPRLSRTIRTVVAVAGCAAFFGAAALLAGQATGVQSGGGSDVVAAPTSTDAIRTADATTGSTTARGGAGTNSPGATTTVWQPPLGTKVAIVGDSLTEGVRSRITPFATRFGFDAKIDAQNGRDIEAGLEPLKKIVGGRDLVVVALGTNDARTGLTSTEADTRIDEVMVQVAGRPVLWVNIYRADTKGTMAAAELFDKELTAATSRYPNLTVLDWSSYIQSRPELMGEDHIHLTSDGYLARAEWLARQIAAGLRLPVPDAPELNR